MNMDKIIIIWIS